MPSDWTYSWVTGRNLNGLGLNKASHSSKRSLMRVELSEDEDTGDETIAITLPRRRKASDKPSSTPDKTGDPAVSATPKKVHFSDKSPKKSALKKSPEASDDTDTTIAASDSTEEKPESGAESEASPAAKSAVDTKVATAEVAANISALVGRCKKAEEPPPSDDSSEDDKALPHPTCQCLNCKNGRKILRASTKKAKGKPKEPTAAKTKTQKPQPEEKSADSSADEATEEDSVIEVVTRRIVRKPKAPPASRVRKGKAKRQQTPDSEASADETIEEVKAPEKVNGKIIHHGNKNGQQTKEPATDENSSKNAEEPPKTLPFDPKVVGAPHLIKRPEARVIQVEDVVETATDPIPNAFMDTASGIMRVYHGPRYSNRSDRLYPISSDSPQKAPADTASKKSSSASRNGAASSRSKPASPVIPTPPQGTSATPTLPGPFPPPPGGSYGYGNGYGGPYGGGWGQYPPPTGYPPFMPYPFMPPQGPQNPMAPPPGMPPREPSRATPPLKPRIGLSGMPVLDTPPSLDRERARQEAEARRAARDRHGGSNRGGDRSPNTTGPARSHIVDPNSPRTYHSHHHENNSHGQDGKSDRGGKSCWGEADSHQQGGNAGNNPQDDGWSFGNTTRNNKRASHRFSSPLVGNVTNLSGVWDSNPNNNNNDNDPKPHNSPVWGGHQHHNDRDNDNSGGGGGNDWGGATNSPTRHTTRRGSGNDGWGTNNNQASNDRGNGWGDDPASAQPDNNIMPVWGDSSAAQDTGGQVANW